MRMLMRRSNRYLIAILFLLHGPGASVPAQISPGDGHAVPPVTDFCPTRLKLDLPEVRVNQVIAEITRLTNNPIPLGDDFKDRILPGFRAAGTFWEVMHRLYEVSGHVLRWKDRGH